MTHGVRDMAELVLQQGRFLAVLHYAFGREQSPLSVLVDLSLLLIHTIDRPHVIREPVVLVVVFWDQEFVNYDGAAGPRGVGVSCRVLKLRFDGREEARVSQLVSVVVKHLRLLI